MILQLKVYNLYIDSKIGYMLKFEDVALGGQAFGELCKTEDGGLTWTNIFYGIGNEEKICQQCTLQEMVTIMEEIIGLIVLMIMGKIGQNNEKVDNY